MLKKFFLIICILIITLTSGCSFAQKQEKKNEETVDVVKKEEKVNININALGDIMCHQTNFTAAKKGDAYDFTFMFQEAADYIKNADYIVGNLETVFAGKQSKYSGYPTFNTPEEYGKALKNVLNINLVSTANNHSLDRGFTGITRTIDYLNDFGIKHVGTYKTVEDSNNIFIDDIKGVKVAFLSYTYGINGIPVPSGKEYCVNLIDRDKILADSKKADSLGADYIIILLHWGQEYIRRPNNEQKDLAKWIFENVNCSLIIGNHAHVSVGPVEEFNVLKDGKEKKGIVCYALGNFMSGQYMDFTDTSITLNFDITIDKTNPNNNIINKIKYTPLFVDRNSNSTGKGYRVINMNKGIRDYENKKDSLISKSDYDKMLRYKREYQKLLLQSPLIVENNDI